MEHHSQSDASVEPRRLLDAQIRESFARVVYSHKVHEKQADILMSLLSKIKLAQISLSAISTTGFVTTLLGAGWWGSVAGGLFSVALLVLNLYTRNYDLGKEAQQHKEAAINTWAMREKYFSLVTDFAMGSISIALAQERRDSLLQELKAVYANSPNTSAKAYKKAHKALNFQEEMTFAPDEVDAFLPEQLRRKQ